MCGRPPGHTAVVLEATVDLPLGVQAPSQARAWLSVTLTAWLRHDTLDVAKLLTSELVTNAVRYGGAPLHLTVASADGGCVRVEVQDSMPGAPRLRDAGPDAEGGRGLRLVEALASAWGVVPQGTGKGVWFEVAARA